jgi:hypothetical protein
LVICIATWRLVVSSSLAALGAVSLLISAERAHADNIGYLINATVRPGYNFLNAEARSGAGNGVCDQIKSVLFELNSWKLPTMSFIAFIDGASSGAVGADRASFPSLCLKGDRLKTRSYFGGPTLATAAATMSRAMPS